MTTPAIHRIHAASPRRRSPRPGRDPLPGLRLSLRSAPGGEANCEDLGRGQGAPRRQGGQPGGDDPARAAGAPWLHRDHRGVPRILETAQLAAGPLGAGGRCAAPTLESGTGKRFGDPANPLLVSCRSGAKFSMPGMMDTVLNIGLNARTVDGLAALTGDARFAWDAYRRLIQMFGTVVLGVRDEPFEARPRRVARAASAWRTTPTSSRRTCGPSPGASGPSSASSRAASSRTTRRSSSGSRSEAVFRSWKGKRAPDYRRAAGIPDDLGTAVNIVAMVFGNMGEDSATGVATTRNLSTGEDAARRRLPAQCPGRGRGRGHPRDASRSPGWPTQMPEAFTRAARRSPDRSRSTTATCRTSSSRSSAASSGCCRPATASAPRRPRSRSRSTWRRRS